MLNKKRKKRAKFVTFFSEKVMLFDDEKCCGDGKKNIKTDWLRRNCVLVVSQLEIFSLIRDLGDFGFCGFCQKFS